MKPKLRFPEFTDEWREVRFLDKIDLLKGKKPKEVLKQKQKNTLPYLTLEYFREKKIKEYIPIEENKILRVQKGDLVIIADGSRSGELFFCDREGVLVSTMAKLEITEHDLSKKYVFWFLNTHFEHLNKSKYTAIPHVNKNFLKNLKIPIPFRNNQPDLEEQKKIADFLTAIDDKIDLQTKKIDRLETYKKGIMQKLLSGEMRFPGFTDEWREVKLGEIAKVTKGKQLNRLDMIENAPIPVINGGIKPSGYTYEFNMKANTITISEGGNSCGFVNIIKENFWCGGHCYAIEPLENNLISKYFLYHCLKFNQKNIMRLRVGSGLPNIQKKDLLNLSIIIPSLKEQQKIADFLSSIDNKIEAEKKKLEHLKAYKKGLLQKMFV